jgi:hypothetical protein
MIGLHPRGICGSYLSAAALSESRAALMSKTDMSPFSGHLSGQQRVSSYLF